MGKHNCITIEQMEQWARTNDARAMQKANKQSFACLLCMRILRRFWASHQNRPLSKT